MPTHRVVKIDELSQYFHLPEKAVARQLGVCLTSLKKICRQNGITRWPYRKLKSIEKKIHKIENALASTTEDPSAMIMKWETLKLEKKNLPFAGNGSEDDSSSDSETKKRSSPVANTAAAARSAASHRSPAYPSLDDKTMIPEWSSAAASSAASGATTPGSGVPQRCLHTMLEQKLRQVGCVAAHREQLAARQAAAAAQPCPIARPIPIRPDDIVVDDVCVQEEEVESELSAGPLTDDFYGRAGMGFMDSARGLSAREASMGGLDAFKMPMFSASGEISINDLFPSAPEEQGSCLSAMGSSNGLGDLYPTDEYSMLVALS